MAKKAKRVLAADPRYGEFVKRYAFDPLRFFIEVLGINPTWQQVDMINSVAPSGSRTSVSSGHGTGKTSAFAGLSLWHLTCYYLSNTIITAPKLGTVRDGVWKEFADLKLGIEQGAQSWIADYIVVETEKVYIIGQKLNWWVVAKTAPRGRPENLAGNHRDWLFILADEASGIPDENFGVLGGALTDARNRMLLASQPTRDSGFFRETHHSLSIRQGGRWNPLVFNSEESPLVDMPFIKDKLLEYGGRDSVEYCIKVRGIFPVNSDKYLLSRVAIEKVIGAAAVIEPTEQFGWVLLVDVGAGEHRDKSVCLKCKVYGQGSGEDITPRRVDVVDIPICTNTRDLDDFAAMVKIEAGLLSNCSIYVDAVGLGISVCQKLERLNVPNVNRVLWGITNFKKKYKERFINQRAQCCVFAAQAVKSGRISIVNKFRGDVLDQGSRIPYYFNEKGQYQIASKKEMLEDGIPSPDIWDCVSMAFLEDVNYIISEGSQLYGTEDKRARSAQAAEAALEGID